MHFPNRLLVSSAALSVFLVPAMGWAAHSVCVTGGALSPTGSDATTNDIVNQVCSTNSQCCLSRWSLACVQKAAAYAYDSSGGDDRCGRYAWRLSPEVQPINGLPSDYQHIPADFNLVAVKGSVTGTHDVEGAVAVAQSIQVSSFNINWGLNDLTAILAGEKITLKDGTVHGTAQWGTIFSGTRTTFLDSPTDPSQAKSPFAINWAYVSGMLADMSSRLAAYDAIPATSSYGTVTFKGTDPELNVFSATESLLGPARTLNFDVPSGSAIIVNVSDQIPNIQGAGFTGTYSVRKLLWNFPNATKLMLRSIGFGGSILAPKAIADFQAGYINGTVVVASGNVDMELHSFPYEVPSCTGGLCLDPTWSCSADTIIDDRGRAEAIQSEAGFLQIEGEVYKATDTDGNKVSRQSPRNRVWYAFQPAKVMPKSKPVAVLFNGGPGAGTSHVLFAFNTAAMTLDPQRVGSSDAVVDSSAWTDLFNLLYIDAPATGFSYPIPWDDSSTPTVGIDADNDAGIFLRVLVQFLDCHPALKDNRIVLVPESYGGERATLMLKFLYDYPTLTDPSEPYNDPLLASQLGSYFNAVFGTPTPSASALASKFGHQIMIEPVVAGGEQSNDGFDFTQCLGKIKCYDLSATDPKACDSYNCDQGPTYSEDLEEKVAKKLTIVSTLDKALGVHAETIEWMKATSRTGAYGRDDGTMVVTNSAWNTTFGGAVSAPDSYFVLQNDAVFDGYDSKTRMYWSTDNGQLLSTAFVRQLHNNVASFITVAKFDSVIWSPSIPDAFNTYGGDFLKLVSHTDYDPNDTRTGLARHGSMEVFFFGSNDRSLVPMPTMYQAGHTIPMHAPTASEDPPRQLLADVKTWYASTPH